MKRKLACVALVLMVIAAGIAAQAKPNFSGSWIRDEARTTSKTNGRATTASGSRMPIGVTEIRQTPTELTIANEIMGMSMTYVLKLDGSESVNHNGAMTQTTRSHWNGARLVTEGKETQTTSQGYEEWTLKATRTLDAKGSLIVDATHMDLQGVVTTTHQVFTKNPR
jgi:hypothetical protein